VSEVHQSEVNLICSGRSLRAFFSVLFILETISILAEAMMTLSYNTVEIIDLSNFLILIYH
jgi:hypothetical protein